MIRIGITGGIGSGKTTVCKVFELLKIPVFYADDEAKRLMTEDKILINKLVDAFGDKTYIKGILDRKYLAQIVFKNALALKKLNSLVHPAVFEAFDKWYLQQKSPYVLKEAALLFESNSYKQNNFNLLVSSPINLRIKRVMGRDGVSEKQVLERINNQMSEENKQKMADFIIFNNETDFIIPQVLALHNKFLAKAIS